MIFVQATDIRYYADPVIVGSDYHIHFGDAEPKIVVKKFRNTTFQSARKRATNILGKMGRVLPREPVHTAGLEFDFELLKPIPVPLNFTAVVQRPRADSEFLGWEMDFPTEDIKQALDRGGDYNVMLHVFLLGESWFKRDFKDRVGAALRKQITAGWELNWYVRLKRA